MDLEQEIAKLQLRNRKVEADKAWETALLRKVFLMALTFLTAFAVFTVSGVPDDFKSRIVSALVPAAAYLLSTLALPFLRRFWERWR